tara:strand:+ start:457 stop:651 length:195 start_codon:yes stop_codon:yes gene_type:complete
MEEVNNKYHELCLTLGDITVKKKGLSNQEAQIFEELNRLDEQARKLQQVPGSKNAPVAKESKSE